MQRSGWIMWPALVAVAAVIALARDLPTVAAVYAGILAVDLAAAFALGRRTGAWWGEGRAGFRRIAWWWAPVAAVHFGVGWAFSIGDVDFTGAMLVMGGGLPAFFAAGTGFAHLRYMRLAAATLEPGERLLEICSGVAGEPPRYSLLAATDRRVLGFVQTSMVRASLDQQAAVERTEIVDVDLSPTEDGAVRVTVRTAERELALTGAVSTMAESFARALRGN
jgi:hypothetical protein